ncbi:hypothetical protein AAM22_gp07 [Pantoea phage vB_PagM_AAM22]|nr:hypothetical protein AAM22_gp07 [Pantoea phage vB_PagM_AAM22]
MTDLLLLGAGVLCWVMLAGRV